MTPRRSIFNVYTVLGPLILLSACGGGKAEFQTTAPREFASSITPAHLVIDYSSRYSPREFTQNADDETKISESVSEEGKSGAPAQAEELPLPLPPVPPLIIPEEDKAALPPAVALPRPVPIAPAPTKVPIPTATPSPAATPTSSPTPSSTPTPAVTRPAVPPVVAPGLSLSPVQAGRDMNGPGVLKPTVYYFIVVNEDLLPCEKSTELLSEQGAVLLKVCKRTAVVCAMEGSCGVTQNGETRTFNYVGRVNSQYRYLRIDGHGCRFGYGVGKACLDPFYTLAADLSIYKSGEVIFIPKVVGTVLPDGSVHSGYFVIRDTGNAIRGRGRFDFFTGTMSWFDPRNPFNHIGLASQSTAIPYYRVDGETAKRVLESRAFPHLPMHLRR